MMEIDGYLVDAEIVGEPTYESEITVYPVEQGVDLTDHIRKRPVTLNVEGIISDTPIGRARERRETDGVLIDPTTGELGGEGPTHDAHLRFVDMYERSEPVTVVCALGTLDNMAMMSYVPRREGGSLRFTATFQYVRIITNERTVLRVAVPRASGKDNIRKPATFLESDRGNAQFIDRDIVPSGPFKGTSIYHYSQDHPDPNLRGRKVPNDVIDGTVKDHDAVRVKYVNGQAVPYDQKDYQPYVPGERGGKQRPWWPEDDATKGAPFSNNSPGARQFSNFNLPGIGR